MIDPEQTHAETAEAWNAVARLKYRDELRSRVALLRNGGHSLLDVEIRELEGALPGASVVHLQCSHGLDTLSLLRLGASRVVGVDASAEMIRLAKELAQRLGDRAQWFCADVLDVPEELDGSADLVYTGKGSLPWIMDLGRWAEGVKRLLRPGGTLYLLEGHPLDNLWDRQAPDVKLRGDGAGYFDPEARQNPGFPASVLQREASGVVGPVLRERFWRPSEVMAALSGVGLKHGHFAEHPDLFWDQFPNWPSALKNRLPHSYSLLYHRPVALTAGLG